LFHLRALLRFSPLDADWLVAQAKLHDLQNRLGFIVAMAQAIGTKAALDQAHLAELAALEERLERSRLAREDTLCNADMDVAERKAVLTWRGPVEEHWNLVTYWKAELGGFVHAALYNLDRPTMDVDFVATAEGTGARWQWAGSNAARPWPPHD
jgi:hypothetical protein